MKFLDRSIYLFAPEKNRSSFLAKRYADRLVTERIDMLIAIAPAVFWAVYAGSRSFSSFRPAVAWRKPDIPAHTHIGSATERSPMHPFGWQAPGRGVCQSVFLSDPLVWN